jgi:SAM-dependent MidA family methyltransferase
MGSSAHFLEIMAAEPDAARGVPFARYMELAMYHPTAGYYTRDFRRVGRDRKADFYTATSFNPVFGELLAAAVAKRRT